MAFVLGVLGTVYIANYIEVNILDPTYNTVNGWIQYANNSIDEYQNAKTRTETEKQVLEAREVRERMRKKYNL